MTVLDPHASAGLPGGRRPPGIAASNPLLHPPGRIRLARLQQLAGAGARHGASFLRALPARHGRPASTLAAVELRLAFQGLGPAFVKMGQFVSSSPGTFPASLVEEFSHCQDAVPAEPWEVAAAAIERELGDLDEHFRRVDWRPLAAGSIAQVHAAELHSGESVVIKVQRTNLEAVLRQDLRMIMGGARLAVRLRPSLAVANPVGVIEDFADTLVQELSFRREGAHMDEMRRCFTGWPVVIPEVHHELTTDRVIVMERLYGTKVGADLEPRSAEDGESFADLVIGGFLSTALREGVFHGDGHAGNMFLLPDGRLGLLDFGIMGRLSDHERAAVSRFLHAIFEARYDDVIAGIIELTGASMSDVDAAVADLADVAGRYLGGPLADMRMGALFGELLSSANRHGMSLPTNHVLLFKQLLYLDGLCRRLNPGFDVFRDGSRYVPYFAPEAGGAPRDAPLVPGASGPQHEPAGPITGPVPNHRRT